MKYYGSIYKITNKLDNKIYIGQTTYVDPLKRILIHFKPKKDHISYISRAIQKYGKENQYSKKRRRQKTCGKVEKTGRTITSGGPRRKN